MIKQMNRIFMAVLVLALGLISTVQAAPSDRDITQLLDISGVSAQISEFPLAIKEGIADAVDAGRISSDSAFKVQQQIDLSLNEAVILSDISQSLKTEMSATEVDELLTWFDSELGRRVTSEEAKASDADSQALMMAHVQSLMQDQSRMAQAAQINKEAGVTEITLEMQKQVASAIFVVLQRSSGEGGDIDLDGFHRQLMMSESDTRQQVDQMVTIALAFTYRNLDQNTLQSYIGFLSQPTTQKFNRTVQQSINNSIEQVVRQWAANLSVAAR
ncbi:DUF2059 domain-containing protein [Oceanospirillum sp.]|uniref:DUF2059 domain-containing protein n=1 Tax=Oceanospirillum sp. TaxID=2021254 RepID=UPI003A8FD15E